MFRVIVLCVGAGWFLASSILVGAGLRAAEPAPAEAVAVTLALDREVYLPGTPVQLVVEAANRTDKPAGIFYAGPWPPPWPKKYMLIPPFNISRLLDGLECTLSDPRSEGAIMVLPIELDEKRASDLPRESEPLVLLKPGEKKFWRVPLPVRLMKPGKGEITCALPRLKAAIGDRSVTIEARQKLGITVIPEADTLKGIEAEVKMVSGENAVPTLVWSLKPPKGQHIAMPNFSWSNCRVLISDANGRLIQERFWNPSGQKEGEADWSDLLSWQIALRLDDFAMVFGELFPGPGTYTVEASYRDFVPLGHRAIPRFASEYQEGRASPFFSNQVEVKRDRGLLPNYEVRSENLESSKGQWLAFSKSFQVEITPDRWKLMTKNREAK